MLFRPTSLLLSATRRIELRRDIRRAALVAAGIAGTMASVIFFATGNNDQAAELAEREFGRGIRTGTILFMPAAGDTCRQASFDNDNGAVRQTEDISCLQAIGHAQNYSTEGAWASGLHAIGESFRK